MLSFAMGENLEFTLAGVALATLLGILLNIFLPKEIA
jgi:uracil permease